MWKIWNDPIGNGVAESEWCHKMENKPECEGAEWMKKLEYIIRKCISGSRLSQNM
jgi:hypothetical protein